MQSINNSGERNVFGLRDVASLLEDDFKMFDPTFSVDIELGEDDDEGWVTLRTSNEADAPFYTAIVKSSFGAACVQLGERFLESEIFAENDRFPICLIHRDHDTHLLEIKSLGKNPYWCCTQSGNKVASVGRLNELGPHL